MAKGETSCRGSSTFEFKESDNVYISLFICLIIYYDSLLFVAKVISPVTPLKHYYLVIQSNFFGHHLTCQQGIWVWWLFTF